MYFGSCIFERMKSPATLTLLTLLGLLLFGQCTIEKRLYTKGFHIERRGGLQSAKEKTPFQETNTVISVAENQLSPTVTFDSIPNQTTVVVQQEMVQHANHPVVQKNVSEITQTTLKKTDEPFTKERRKEQALKLGAWALIASLATTACILGLAAIPATQTTAVLLLLIGGLLLFFTALFLWGWFIDVLFRETVDKPVNKGDVTPPETPEEVEAKKKRQRTLLLVLLIASFGLVLLTAQ